MRTMPFRPSPQPSARPSARPSGRLSARPSAASVAGGTLAAVAAVGLVAAGARLGRAVRGVPTAIGASRRRIAAGASAQSSQYERRTFYNRLPTTVLDRNQLGSLISAALHRANSGSPAGEVPLVRPAFPAAAGELAATWLGHASVLIEIDGYRVLADPVWGDRVSPSAVVGPLRLHPSPVPLGDLPAVDAVLISHDHYDHLDLPTVRELLSTQRAPFVVPLGIGAHLRGWGVPEDRIIELDWDQQTSIGSLVLTCTEARHFSGRGLTRNTTLWSSWALTGPRHRVYFGGDTGYTPAFAEIGARLGPFDLTLMPIGAYGDQWPDIHLNPEQAWRAHGDLGGDVLVPIHWATFDLAFHAWAEPVLRLLAAARAGDGTARIVIPRPGARIELTGGPLPDPAADDWWMALTGEGAVGEAPIPHADQPGHPVGRHPGSPV